MHLISLCRGGGKSLGVAQAGWSLLPFLGPLVPSRQEQEKGKEVTAARDENHLQVCRIEIAGGQTIKEPFGNL